MNREVPFLMVQKTARAGDAAAVALSVTVYVEMPFLFVNPNYGK
jgi:hypothetical protein